MWGREGRHRIYSKMEQGWETGAGVRVLSLSPRRLSDGCVVLSRPYKMVV